MKKRVLAVILVLVMLAGLAAIIPYISADSAIKTVLAYGDVNGDGCIDNGDAALVLKHDAALTELTSEQLIFANVNCDAFIDNADAAMILRYDAGIIDSFPANKKEESSIDVTDSSESNADDSSAAQYPEGAYVVKVFDSADDIVWDSVAEADIDIYKWVNSVEYEAYAQLVYIKDYGFLCRMTCFEDDPPAKYTQFGDPVYLDSCMEFFAAWDNRSYINIESNSLGTLCSQFGATKNNRKPITDYLAMNEIFEVNPVVEDGKWSLTIDIPISKLQKFYGNTINSKTFASGYTFTGNFYKIGSDAVTGIRHYGMWTEVKGDTPNFHQPDCFGTFVIE